MSRGSPSTEDAYPLPDDIQVTPDGFIPPEELVAHFDANRDGKVSVEDYAEISAHDKLDKNLERIKNRRVGKKGIFRGPEGLTFLGGLTYGIVFFGIMSTLSTGLLGSTISNSVWLDQQISDTAVDPGGECLDSSGTLWINVWVDNDYQKIKIRVFNVDYLDDEAKYLRWELDNNNGVHEEGQIGNVSEGTLSYTPYLDGTYELKVFFHNLTGVNLTNQTTENKILLIKQSQLHTEEPVTIPIEIHTNDATLPWEKESVKEAKITETGDRICLTYQQLGAWSWALMGAEWAGGRETAMLTGGSAGVPAWWMAFISLSMSIFFLCVQYPLMYRFYHKEIDDILSDDELHRVVQRALERCEQDLHLSIDWGEFKMRKRTLSIDVLVPYRATESAVIEPSQVSTAMQKEVVDDFKIYGELTPLQLKADALDDHRGAFESLSHNLRDIELPELSAERPALVQDYSDFFGGIHNTAALQKRVEGCLKDFMSNNNLEEKGYWIVHDENRVAIRLIYKPKIRFAFFKFGQSYAEIEDDLKEHLKTTVSDDPEEFEFTVSCRNEVATMADRTGAGRIESGGGEHQGQAIVARQEGLAGTILQSQFMGDILSSVEYVAHENREKIDRWGFFGLIVFVWIPFMASGVLVGAMMGLVARMPFLRVLTACFIGGAAASITWAYTAESIIDFLHALNAELFIPIIIGVIFIAAIMHIRTNKRRRQEELFKGSLSFFAGETED
ncbi:MAG: small multi-drug export protein [Candidatus Thalassarchaeaceae archaeon]|nr:small multi-drug export protein [Candidatus Thalassarchaeaceae archaeon]